MDYIFVLNENGVRQTSYVLGIHADTFEEVQKMAKSEFPKCTLLQGDSDMQSKFTEGKAYVNGKFIDIPVEVKEETKAEKIADIRKYYDSRFEMLDKAVLRRRLANADISDLQTQYKTLQNEMITKIKEVK